MENLLVLLLHRIISVYAELDIIFKKNLIKYLLGFLPVTIVSEKFYKVLVLNILLKEKFSKYSVRDISVVLEPVFLPACEIITETNL